MRHLHAILCLAAALFGCGCGRHPDDALASLTARGYSLSVQEFHRAAKGGDAEALRLFLEAGTAVDVRSADGRTALVVAAHAGKHEAVDYLLKRGASSSTPGLLAAAVMSGQVRVYTLLQEAGVLPPAEDGLLAKAAELGHLEMTRLLLPLASPPLRDAALRAACAAGRTSTATATAVPYGAFRCLAAPVWMDL